MSSAFSWLFPASAPAVLPALRGPFQAVGVAHRYIPTNFTKQTHAGRQASHTLTDQPEIGVHVYYPSGVAASEAPGAPFMSQVASSALAAFAYLPGFLLTFLSRSRIRAVADAPMAPLTDAPAKLPIVIMSHGLSAVAGMYAFQASELASQGYVVFAPTHNDGSACITELSAGRTLPFVRLPLFGGSAEDFGKRQAQLHTRANEVSYIIDVIEQAEKTSWPISVPFAGRLDTSRIGLVGHSFGGGTVITAAAQDPRIKAVVAHDLWAAPAPAELWTSGLAQPLLCTQSDDWVGMGSNTHSITSLVSRSRSAGYLLHLRGVKHSNFCDVPFFKESLARTIRLIGPRPFTQAMHTINSLQTQFFAQHLNGDKSAKAMFEEEVASDAVTVLSARP